MEDDLEKWFSWHGMTQAWNKNVDKLDSLLKNERIRNKIKINKNFKKSKQHKLHFWNEKCKRIWALSNASFGTIG